jgi:hypothetical protein
VCVPGQIRGGLGRPGRHVDVSAFAAIGSGGTQQLAQVAFANQHVGGGQIADQSRARGHQEAAGRRLHPQVFADLYADHEIGQLLCGEQEIRAEGYACAQHVELAARRDLRAWAKPAPLLELTVVRQIALRHDAEQLSLLHRGGDVIHAYIRAQRQAHEEERCERGAGFDHLSEPALCTIQEHAAREQIARGVAGQAQLGKDHDLRRFLIGRAHQLERGERIVFEPGDPDARDRAHYPGEATHVANVCRARRKGKL